MAVISRTQRGAPLPATAPPPALLVRATQVDVRRLCAALVDRDSADDLAQETYLRAHRALAGYDARVPITASPGRATI